MTPWKNKRKLRKAEARQKYIDCCRFGLMTEKAAGMAVREAWDLGQVDGQRMSGQRIKDLASGLHGIILGPVGQTQLEAYETAYRVVMAEKYTPPREVERMALDHFAGKHLTSCARK